MDLEQRKDLLERLGKYILSADLNWKSSKEKAFYENSWFTSSFTELASFNIATEFLNSQKLGAWTKQHHIAEKNPIPLTVGLVMAGNIPMVGFHDFLCGFISGHRQRIKLSSKDAVLLPHLVEKLYQWDPEAEELVSFSEMLKGCDAYIATGSNNSARYFHYYFAKYPHIIRRNRTSVAVLDASESESELQSLADDVYQYFGLGCRNVTKLYVPKGYNFEKLLEAFRKYDHIADHSKYKNNYDYQLAILIVNKLYYMTNGSIILVEDPGVFSPISRLHYEYYSDKKAVLEQLQINSDIQCIVSHETVPFGKSQLPALTDFADGVNTLQFFRDLSVKVS